VPTLGQMPPWRSLAGGKRPYSRDMSVDPRVPPLALRADARLYGT
jgi:hypothetical protein